MVFNSNDEIIDQFNFESSFLTENKIAMFYDIDDNGFKEIYNLTKSKDSVFLNIVFIPT